MSRDRWKDSNPLRKYREEHGISQAQVSVLLDVSTTTIQHWESGAVQPSPENLLLIGRFMKQPDIARVWADWYSRRPRLAAA